jgi:hypothetical protein
MTYTTREVILFRTFKQYTFMNNDLNLLSPMIFFQYILQSNTSLQNNS